MPETCTVFTDQIGQLLSEINYRREEIKNEYLKAWLATLSPKHTVDIDWIIQNVEMVEKWSAGIV